MKPLLVTSGEPAGIGMDVCLDLATCTQPLVVFADINELKARAKHLKRAVVIEEYTIGTSFQPKPHHLKVLHCPVVAPVRPGELNQDNASYVIDLLTQAGKLCLAKDFSALVTAPVHKGIINDAGIAFSGHTEFFARLCGVAEVVMLLVCSLMKVALVTTHLPLRHVAEAVTGGRITHVLTCLHQSLQHDFGIKHPRLMVAGLNPHAGEGGHLGREELDIIIPTLQQLIKGGMDIKGPLPADTLFSPHHLKECDAFVAMYHDQGLSVLKYASFGEAVNVTLGLPIIRTSVDQGTALTLAGSGQAQSRSLFAAVHLAARMATIRAGVA